MKIAGQKVIFQAELGIGNQGRDQADWRNE